LGEWVTREDVGTESFTEKEKGSYSDSFKRAGFRFGIGIELYTAPHIWIVGNTEKVKDKWVSKIKPQEMEVTEYGVKDNRINILKISYKGKNLFSFDNGKMKIEDIKEEPKTEPETPSVPLTDRINQAKTVKALEYLWTEIAKLQPEDKQMMIELCTERKKVLLASNI
jgi:hypothetical protein